MINIRRFREDDAPPIMRLFEGAIRRVNSRDYSPEQIRVWAAAGSDEKVWAAKLARRHALVAEIEDVIVGFADLDSVPADQYAGHIDHL